MLITHYVEYEEYNVRYPDQNGRECRRFGLRRRFCQWPIPRPNPELFFVFAKFGDYFGYRLERVVGRRPHLLIFIKVMEILICAHLGL